MVAFDLILKCCITFIELNSPGGEYHDVSGRMNLFNILFSSFSLCAWAEQTKKLGIQTASVLSYAASASGWPKPKSMERLKNFIGCIREVLSRTSE